MEPAQALLQFNQTLQTWQKALDAYLPGQLIICPSPAGWSVGQLYTHILSESTFFLSQVRACLHSADHALEATSPTLAAWLLANQFPDIQLEGPPENDRVPDPGSAEPIRTGILLLFDDAAETAAMFATARGNGKTRHPGLGYLGAAEWFQFAGMHLRHHLRQKKRMDDFLAGYSLPDGKNRP